MRFVKQDTSILLIEDDGIASGNGTLSSFYPPKAALRIHEASW